MHIDEKENRKFIPTGQSNSKYFADADDNAHYLDSMDPVGGNGVYTSNPEHSDALIYPNNVNGEEYAAPPSTEDAFLAQWWGG